MRMMSESPGSVMESDDTRKYLPHAVPKSTLSAHTRTQVHHQSQTAVIDQPIDWAVSVWPGRKCPRDYEDNVRDNTSAQHTRLTTLNMPATTNNIGHPNSTSSQSTPSQQCPCHCTDAEKRPRPRHLNIHRIVDCRHSPPQLSCIKGPSLAVG